MELALPHCIAHWFLASFHHLMAWENFTTFWDSFMKVLTRTWCMEESKQCLQHGHAITTTWTSECRHVQNCAKKCLFCAGENEHRSTIILTISNALLFGLLQSSNGNIPLIVIIISKWDNGWEVLDMVEHWRRKITVKLVNWLCWEKQKIMVWQVECPQPPKNGTSTTYDTLN